MSVWPRRFLDLADHIAQWSKDPSTKVGAVIVNDRKRVVGMGYNGFPDRIEDDADLLADRDHKLELVIHGEVNAILNATASVQGCTLYVNYPPCKDCAKFIIQAGIAKVFYRPGDPAFEARWAENINRSKDIFARANVGCYAVPVCHAC